MRVKICVDRHLIKVKGIEGSLTILPSAYTNAKIFLEPTGITTMKNCCVALLYAFFNIQLYTKLPAQSIVNPTIPTKWTKDDLASYEGIIYNSLPSVEGKAKVILNLTNRKSVWSRVLPITGLLPIFFTIDLCHPIFIKSIQFNFYLERS